MKTNEPREMRLAEEERANGGGEKEPLIRFCCVLFLNEEAVNHGCSSRERERERGRLVLRRMPMDAASLHSGEDNREGRKDIYEQGASK